MKRILGLLMAFMFYLGVFTLVGGVNTVKAAEDDIASGTSGTCSWVIDADGVLTISPTDGVSGQLREYTAPNSSSAPWYNYGSDIKKLVVKPGVKTGSKCVYLFGYLTACTEMDLSGLDTTNATSFYAMFNHCYSLKSIDLSGFDTSNVTDMQGMLAYCDALESIDLSSFDTSKTTNAQIFLVGRQYRHLESIKLGEDVVFKGNNITSEYSQLLFPTPVTSIGYTGKWIREDGFYGPYTPAELRDNYTSRMAGTWIAEVAENPYAVFDSETGTLYFVRAKEVHDHGSVGTVHSISGGDYTGTIYAINETDTGINHPWMSVGSQVKKVQFVDEIKPRNMQEWFYGFTNCMEMDLSKLNTSETTNMNTMFYNCRQLSGLNLSNFDTSKVNNMTNMFTGCTQLKSVNLGEKFTFNGYGFVTTSNAALLPTPSGAQYTGKWIREDKAFGPYTPVELRYYYDESAMPGVWIWELKPTEYTLSFAAGENGAGAMASVNAPAKEDFTLPANQFVAFGYDFDHWDDGNGHTYADKGTIPANTYAADKKVTLTAVWKKRDTSLNWNGNEAEFSIRGGEQAVLDNIPAGTSYQVYELTPDGWVLVQQENSSGVIEALEESSAAFWNKYQPGVTTVQFSGLKNLDGRPAKAGSFTFELYEGETLVDTATTQDGGFIQFKVIEYDAAGDHVYTIREVDPNDDTIDYDTHEETVEVSVTDNGDGTLSSEVTYDDDGIVFSNATRPGTLRITKDAMNGTSQNANDEFTIEIEFRNESGMPINDNIYWYVEGGATTPSEISGGNQE